MKWRILTKVRMNARHATTPLVLTACAAGASNKDGGRVGVHEHRIAGLEVVRTLAADLGLEPEQLEKIRETRHHERGGFADRIIWTGNH